MNHSIYGADRATHLKIVAVALVFATLVAGVGVAARISGEAGQAGRAQALIPLEKAGAPVAVSNSGTTVIR